MRVAVGLTCLHGAGLIFVNVSQCWLFGMDLVGNHHPSPFGRSSLFFLMFASSFFFNILFGGLEGPYDCFEIENP